MSRNGQGLTLLAELRQVETGLEGQALLNQLGCQMPSHDYGSDYTKYMAVRIGGKTRSCLREKNFR